jgi:hypothetical protein
MRQVNDEPKPVYKVGFIREKGKAAVREVQHSPKPVACCSGEGWDIYGCFNSGLGDSFVLGCGFVGFLR